jgi:hypothetical protein
VRNIDALTRDLGSIPWTTDPTIIRRKSRDHFVISPLLRAELTGNLADVVVSPRTKSEVAAVVAAAVKHRVPITPRGGGTANYGQSVPLHGGVLLDMIDFSKVIAVGDGVIRAEAGANMAVMDAAAREKGWELRIHPSTIATSTIAGFVAGGSGGIGSAMWGMLRDRGNIVALEVMSAEETPRLTEMTGDEVELVHHAYGANAVITEVSMPLAPATHWRECIVVFPEFTDALRFGVQLVRETGIVKKLASVHEWPIPQLMRELRNIVPEGHSMVECYVAPASFASFQCLVDEFGGRVASDTGMGENPFGAPLYEFAYGHGLRQLQKNNPAFTGLQGMFRGPDMVAAIETVRHAVTADEPFRLEIFWSEGEVVAMGSPLMTYRDGAQMAAMVSLVQTSGGVVANSHATGVREVGIKRITPKDLVFKREMDPFDLLNPGKLNLDHLRETSLATTGWRFRARA